MQESIPGALTAEQQKAEYHFSTPGETFRAKKLEQHRCYLLASFNQTQSPFYYSEGL